ncbi:MAG: HD-GYP domain-containing protein [Lachnospiraceae bacterium]
MSHYHHEKWNGKGYPEGLSGTDIPVEARIMALADVFDALVSKRCYKEAFSYDKAFSIIEESMGEHFDPELGRIFLECRTDLETLYDGYLCGSN